ncbi:MAG TPA: tripartite tricarboxylate transporter substrate binding protein [Ramlibacter sp.]|jgi:tripartite-type tricarboxylate transporter receptor subunit TctC|nr:tripartite tricarboxylate transporter substrate binding protein [Ramlibacter sp.]
MKIKRLFWLGALLGAFAATASGQAFPAKTVRIIEPAGPGSAVDVFARKLAEGLAARWGQPVVVDNKPGGNSAIGAREAARAAPDGYTLFHANINNSLNDVLLNDPCCRLNEALVPITMLTSSPLVMVVNPGVGPKTLREYIAMAKANPAALTFASGGTGSVTQLLGTKINMVAGLKVQEVPYKAIGAEMPDLLAGHVKTAFLAPVVVTQLIRSGKLVALGVAGSKRIPLLPDVPTLAEAGLPGVEAHGWNGLFVPAGTPRETVVKLQADIAGVMQSAAFQQDARELGYELGGGTAEEFSAYIKSEVNKWGGVIRDAKIKAQ